MERDPKTIAHKLTVNGKAEHDVIEVSPSSSAFDQMLSRLMANISREQEAMDDLVNRLRQRAG